MRSSKTLRISVRRAAIAPGRPLCYNNRISTLRQGSCELYTFGRGPEAGEASPQTPAHGRRRGAVGPSTPPQTVKLLAVRRNLA